MLSGMKTGLIAIRRKFTGYSIFRNDHNGWTCNAGIIFNFTALLVAGNHHIN